MNTSRNQTSNSSSKPKLDKTLSKFINFGVVIAFFGIAILIYWVMYSGKKISKFESFDNIPVTTLSFNSSSNSSNFNSSILTDTVYEKALKAAFDTAPRMICNILATPGNNICVVNDVSYIKYNFPVHIIKIIDGSILAVFNDGRLYKKDTIQNTMWQGPLNNSLPNDIIPLRMITLGNDLVTLLGVGYDNRLYVKNPHKNGTMNLDSAWKLVPNNSDIIYILFDSETGNMISIDILGKLLIKNTSDYTSSNSELVTKLDRPILRLYYDNYGYMLAIDNNFDMYQFTDINWKNSSLNITRGSNSSKIQDILYDTDGRMFGLVFSPKNNILQIMKQDMAYYLGNFLPLDQQITTSKEFVMSDQDILKSKIGNIDAYLKTQQMEEAVDDDTNIAYQKMILQTRADLKSFCSNRNSIANTNFDNYDLLSEVESNSDKILNLKNIIKNIIIYEPDKARIIEKYPIINE
jgi:hypothetical protein